MKIYLAGPDVFRKDALNFFEELKSVALGYGFYAISPLDNIVSPPDSRNIFTANINLIDQADAVVANLTPFRGVGVDDGTAFEIGYAFAKGKIITGYTSYFSLSYKELAEKKTLFLDKEFELLEDFGQPCNLMIGESILLSKGQIFETYENCLSDLRKTNIKNDLDTK